MLVLGIAYKKDIDDPRESPSFELMDLLAAGGAEVSYNDPHVPRLPRVRHHEARDMTSTELTAELLAAQDCVLIATDHSSYDYEFIVRHAPLVVDTAQCHQERPRGPREDRAGVARSRNHRMGFDIEFRYRRLYTTL